MNAMFSARDWTEALGWTLVHFVWQGALVAMALAAMLAIMKPRSASARYLIACASLLVLALVPAYQFTRIMRLALDAGQSPAASIASARELTAASAKDEGVPNSAPAILRNPDRAEPAPAQRGEAAPVIQRLADRLSLHLDWIVRAWLAGVALLSLRLSWGFVAVARLRRKYLSPAGEAVERAARRLGSRLNVGRPVRVVRSALATSPATVGWLKPMILLPASAVTGLAPAHLEALIAHELAHIRRHDYLVNVLQSIVETLLFYHPAVWWVSHRIRIEREHCCDDLAISATGVEPRSYAGALTAMERLRLAPPRLALGAGGGQFSRRIGRLLGVEPALGTSFSRQAAGLICLAMLAAAFGAVQWSARSGQAQQVELPEELYRPIDRDEAALVTSIHGTVLDEADLPVADTLVRAIRIWTRDQPRLTERQMFNRATRWGEEYPKAMVRTDDAGRFGFENLEAGMWAVWADDVRFARDWYLGRRVNLPASSSDASLQIKLYDPQSLTGTVVNESGLRVQEAKVTIAVEWPSWSSRPLQGHGNMDLHVAMTDDNGRFTISRLHPGRVSLLVEHPDYALTWPFEPLFQVGDQEIEITIQDGARFSGRVIAEGQPLAEVDVKIEMGAFNQRLVGRWRTQTDKTGEFRIDKIPDMLPRLSRSSSALLYVSMDSEDWIANRYLVYQSETGALPELPMEARPRAGLSDEEIEEIEGKRVNIRVLSPEDQARLGRIEVRLMDEPDDRWWKHRPSLHVAQIPSQRQVEGRNVTFEDRQWTVDNLEPGLYRIALWAHESPLYPPMEINIAPGDELRLEMKRGPARLSGRLIGRQARSGKEYLSAMGPIAFLQGLTILSGDGKYEIEGLAPGRYQLVYEGDNIARTYFDVTVAEGENTFDVQLPICRLEGRITGGDYEPPDLSDEAFEGRKEIHVIVQGDTPRRGKGVAWVNGDAEGHFFVNNLSPGDYTVRWKRGFTADFTVQPGQRRVDVEITASSDTGDIAGKIKINFPLDLDPFLDEGIAVHAFRKNRFGYSLTVWNTEYVDEKRLAYRMPKLAVGEYAVFVSSSGLGKNVPLTLISNVEVRKDMERHLDIEIPPGRMINLEFNFSGTKPHSLRWDLIYPSGTRLPDKAFVGQRGDSIVARGGRFTLPLGTYRIEIRYDGKPPVHKTISVDPGEGELLVPIKLD